MKVTRLVAISLLFSSTMAIAHQAPDGLQFNVPYLCNDGRIYVVHRCEKGPKFEACYYQTGTDSERYNTRAAVVYQMTKMCKIQAATSSAAAAPQRSDLNNSRWDCGGGSTLTVFQCQKQAGQDYCYVRFEQNGKFLMQAPKPGNEIRSHVKSCKAMPQFNPPYLAEFPNNYRVVQGMVIGNPADNVRRAIGAYYQLSEIIKVLAGSRPLTADEQKFLSDYSRIQSEFVQSAEKKFPGQHFNLVSNPYHYSRTDPRFGFEGIPVWTIFLSLGTQEAFARIVGGNDGSYLLAVGREKNRAMQQLKNDMKAQEADASYAKDAGSVAVRHCIESGRSEMECLGAGIKVGINDLIGGNPVKGILPESPTGLRLTGVYSAGNFGLQFAQDYVMVRCGSLLQQPLSYSVERARDQLSVKISISPKPVVLSYKDGKLVGPGPVDIAGRVFVGGMTDHASTSYEMQTQTSTTQRQIAANEVPGYSADQVHQNGMEYSVDQQATSTSMVPATTHHYDVQTAPKTERCSVGTLPVTGETGSTSGALTQMVGSKASKSANAAPGLRLNGTYAAPGGLRIEFRDQSATLECGEARNSEGYAVVPEGGRLIVKFQNNTGPLSLVLEPNGTLTGSGTINVTGRKAVKSDDGHSVDFLPRNARCTLGTLTPNR